MAAAQKHWSADWSVGLRLWLERGGQAVLGKGRLELLEGIGRCHSISEAARRMGMSYRRAWLLVQAVNRSAGAALVEAAAGGRQGGGARLTPLGQAAVEVFRDLQEELRSAATAALARLVQPREPATIHVAAAVSLEEALGQLLTDYALYRPAVRVRAIFGASDELADQVLGGAPADLFLSADQRQMDRLDAAGLLARGARVPLAENRLAALAPAGHRTTVRRPADLAGPTVVRIALANPACPLGGYTRAYLERLGLYDRLLPRVVPVDNSRSVVAAVRGGRADVGLAYASDAARAEGCRLLFRAGRPAAPIRYEGAVVRRGRQAHQAGALLAFLTSPDAARAFRRCGFAAVRARQN
jgi:molybdate transport system substrate-binding protein